MSQVRVLIVDDEPLARQRIRVLLTAEDDVVVVGESENGRQAVDGIRRLRPDVVFLDVQMPELNGFQVIEEIGVERLPLIVFVTAYDEHAVRAFEVNALDYLLKPFDAARLAATLNRIRRELTLDRVGDSDLRDRMTRVLEQVGARPMRASRLHIHTEGGVTFLPTEEIRWIEAAGNYVRVHTAGATHLLRRTLTSLQDDLDPEEFIRIHRSTIVNVSRVMEVQPAFHGDAVAILDDGSELPVSRSYRSRLLS